MKGSLIDRRCVRMCLLKAVPVTVKNLNHSHAALAMRTEANLPSFLLTHLHVGFLRAQLRAVQSLSIALQPIDELLELSLRRHRLTAGHTL